jgi:predicted MFS family arabinose efflux permease
VEKKKGKKEPPIYANAPVIMTLWIYFVLKLALECLLSSSATLTSFYFGWDAQTVGTFLAFLGLLMFPANMVVAKLSHNYEDRELIYVTLMVMLVSVCGIIAYRPSHYTATQYTVFAVCVFLSANVLEGPNMSLLSKTIPRSWAKGTFNSGFLATEAGTLARSVGDVLISAAHASLGVSSLLNATFLPFLLLVFVTLLLTRRYFDQMIEEDDDDDDSGPKSSDNSRQSSLHDE